MIKIRLNTNCQMIFVLLCFLATAFCEPYFIKASILAAELAPDYKGCAKSAIECCFGAKRLSHHMLLLETSEGNFWIAEKPDDQLYYDELTKSSRERLLSYDHLFIIQTFSVSISKTEMDEFVAQQRIIPYTFTKENCQMFVYRFIKKFTNHNVSFRKHISKICRTHSKLSKSKKYE